MTGRALVKKCPPPPLRTKRRSSAALPTRTLCGHCRTMATPNRDRRAVQRPRPCGSALSYPVDPVIGKLSALRCERPHAHGSLCSLLVTGTRQVAGYQNQYGRSLPIYQNVATFTKNVHERFCFQQTQSSERPPSGIGMAAPQWATAKSVAS